MTIEIQERIEGKRGCGYRKPGGIYLVGPPTGQSCCKLPFPLTVCPTCGHGIHPARGWTWVNAGKLFGEQFCTQISHLHLQTWPPTGCSLAFPEQLGRAGLLWIGEKFYPTPGGFLQEARAMGISRRIPAVPKGFEPGKTWVLLAHRKGVVKIPPLFPGDNRAYDIKANQYLSPGEPTQHYNPEYTPAIFSVFRPSAIEYVIKGDETQDDLEQLIKRGLTPVLVRNRVPYE